MTEAELQRLTPGLRARARANWCDPADTIAGVVAFRAGAR